MKLYRNLFTINLKPWTKRKICSQLIENPEEERNLFTMKWKQLKYEKICSQLNENLNIKNKSVHNIGKSIYNHDEKVSN